MFVENRRIKLTINITDSLSTPLNRVIRYSQKEPETGDQARLSGHV